MNTQKRKDVVRIGCSSAFWGDSATAAHQLVNLGGDLDYIVSDYLAEVTMCILARQREKGPRGGMGEGGYVTEFVESVWKPLMKPILRKKIKLVTNAGGMNPIALKEKIEKVTREAGLEVPIIAAIAGDDLLPQKDQLREEKHFKNFSLVGEEDPFPPEDKMMMSCNAYTGAVPIARALAEGAQIVVTGRAVDSALVLGPLMFEYGWKEDDYNLLSLGSLAGHVVECGCQATGGNFTDWEESCKAGWANAGFPIVEVSSNGSFIVTKPENTGGIVTVGSVSEQILYEIGDPSCYILPDVICDWRNVKVSQEGHNRVRVEGALGKPPTEYYKVSATAFDGYKLGAMLIIGGIDAAEKAKEVGKALFQRASTIFKLRGMEDFRDTNIEVLGAEYTYGPHSRTKNSREVVARYSAYHNDPKALGIFGREIASSATGMAPGIMGGGEGRPHPSPMIRYFNLMIHKSKVPLKVHLSNGKVLDYSAKIPAVPSIPSGASYHSTVLPRSLTSENPSEETVVVDLIRLAFGRSGDKADAANIGVMARKPEYFPFIHDQLTEEAVKEYMGHLVLGSVKRFELPGLKAFNFVLTKSLGGGGIQSLRVDKQGKAYAQMLLSFPIRIPKKLLPITSKL